MFCESNALSSIGCTVSRSAKKSLISKAHCTIFGFGVLVWVIVADFVIVGVFETVGVDVLVGVCVIVGVALGKSKPGIVVFFCIAVPCTTLTRTTKTTRPISNDLPMTAPIHICCSGIADSSPTYEDCEKHYQLLCQLIFESAFFGGLHQNRFHTFHHRRIDCIRPVPLPG